MTLVEFLEQTEGIVGYPDKVYISQGDIYVDAILYGIKIQNEAIALYVRPNSSASVILVYKYNSYKYRSASSNIVEFVSGDKSIAFEFGSRQFEFVKDIINSNSNSLADDIEDRANDLM